MTPRPTSVYQRPRGELVEPRGRDGATKPSFDKLRTVLEQAMSWENEAQ